MPQLTHHQDRATSQHQQRPVDEAQHPGRDGSRGNGGVRCNTAKVGAAGQPTDRPGDRTQRAPHHAVTDTDDRRSRRPRSIRRTIHDLFDPSHSQNPSPRPRDDVHHPFITSLPTLLTSNRCEGRDLGRSPVRFMRPARGLEEQFRRIPVVTAARRSSLAPGQRSTCVDDAPNRGHSDVALAPSRALPTDVKR